MILMTWLNFLTSVAIHGVVLYGDAYANGQLLFQIVLAPFIAVTVAVLALRGERLGLATTFAVLPTLVAIVGVIVFAVAISIYGF